MEEGGKVLLERLGIVLFRVFTVPFGPSDTTTMRWKKSFLGA